MFLIDFMCLIDAIWIFIWDFYLYYGTCPYVLVCFVYIVNTPVVSVRGKILLRHNTIL